MLTLAAWRSANRPALLGIGILGITACVIALAGDLPDARDGDRPVLSSGHFANASSKPSAGLYLETLGALVLMFTSVCGLVLLVPRARRRLRSARRSAWIRLKNPGSLKSLGSA